MSAYTDAMQETVSHFRTSTTLGLSSGDIPALRATSGYNEFSVASTEPAYIKFAKNIYESPLILLLFGSAFVSAVMGNIDDAISITIAIIIVLTGGPCLSVGQETRRAHHRFSQSVSCRSLGRKSR